jgi:hypothetical protein
VGQLEFDRLISVAAVATTNKSLKVAAAELLASLGYTRWIYASENPYGALGFPATLANDYGMWMLAYMSKGYMKVDPVVVHCRISAEPLLWDAREGWDESNEKLRAMMNDAVAHGFGSGLAIPLRLPGEPQGLLHVTSPAPLRESRAQFEEALPQLRQIGNTMHTAMVRIMKETASFHQRMTE